MRPSRAAVVLLFAAQTACPDESASPTVATSPKASAPTLAAAEDATRYRIDLSARRQHLVDVEVAVPVLGRAAVTLMMATWTPGSYLVREFARQVEGVEAFDGEGKARAIRKVAKNRWAVDTSGATSLVVRYRIYARELSVRTSFVDQDYAVLNGASIFLADVDHLDRQHRVAFDLPKGWTRALTSLPRVDEQWVAADYDELVDSPFLVGDPAVRSFEAGGAEHVVAHAPTRGAWDVERSAKDVEQLTKAQLAFWGEAPYERYIFMNVLSEGRGGLEHLGSTVMMTSRFVTRDDEAYRGWLGLVSHELFHAWNGKRLRPEALGPFDYENEVYTTDLWFVEGVTSYYDDLLVARAGLMTKKQWLAALSKNIGAVRNTPGRAYQSLADASYDAWIKFYRHDENSVNTSVSYYSQGAVVAFLVDAMIRRATKQKRSLDDVMREAYRRHAAERGYSSEALLDVFEEVGGVDVRRAVERMVSTTEPLDYEDALEFYGLRFTEHEAKADDPGHLGVNVERSGGRTVVKEVLRGTPAFEAGVNVGDELIALDGDRIEDLAADLKGRPAGEEVKLLVSRRRALKEIVVTLGEKPRTKFTVEELPRAGGAQKRRLERLLAADR